MYRGKFISGGFRFLGTVFCHYIKTVTTLYCILLLQLEKGILLTTSICAFKVLNIYISYAPHISHISPHIYCILLLQLEKGILLTSSICAFKVLNIYISYAPHISHISPHIYCILLLQLEKGILLTSFMCTVKVLNIYISYAVLAHRKKTNFSIKD